MAGKKMSRTARRAQRPGAKPSGKKSGAKQAASRPGAKPPGAKRTRAKPPGAKQSRAKQSSTKRRGSKPTPTTTPTTPTTKAPSLEDHNRHLAILGLPAVRTPLQPGPPAKPLPAAPAGSALAMIDKLYPGEGPTAPRGRFIHWWGQFSDQLPAPFTLKRGGHGYLEARDIEHATRLFAVLRNAVLAMKRVPRRDDDDDDDDVEDLGLEATREWAGISDDGMAWYRWMLIDGRQMTVELKLAITRRELDGDRLLRPR
jgi:hypothetical protein